MLPPRREHDFEKTRPSHTRGHKEHQKCPSGSPRAAQMSPKSGPRRAKMVPGASQEPLKSAPRAARSAPGRPQEGRGATRTPQEDPEPSPGPSRRPPGGHFDVNSDPPELSAEPFWRLLRSLRAPRNAIERADRNHLSEGLFETAKAMPTALLGSMAGLGAPAPLEIRPSSRQAQQRAVSEATWICSKIEFREPP